MSDLCDRHGEVESRYVCAKCVSEAESLRSQLAEAETRIEKLEDEGYFLTTRQALARAEAAEHRIAAVKEWAEGRQSAFGDSPVTDYYRGMEVGAKKVVSLLDPPRNAPPEDAGMHPDANSGTSECPDCVGSGWIARGRMRQDPCPTCSGSGKARCPVEDTVEPLTWLEEGSDPDPDQCVCFKRGQPSPVPSDPACPIHGGRT